MDDPGGFWSNGKGCAMYDYDYDVNRRMSPLLYFNDQNLFVVPVTPVG